MQQYVQGKLDRLVEKAISRKFMVWLTATGLFAFYNLASSDWVMISAIYIGGQAVIDRRKGTVRVAPIHVLLGHHLPYFG